MSHAGTLTSMLLLNGHIVKSILQTCMLLSLQEVSAQPWA